MGQTAWCPNTPECGRLVHRESFDARRDRSEELKVGRQSSGEPRELTYCPEERGAAIRMAAVACEDSYGVGLPRSPAWNLFHPNDPNSDGSREDSRPTVVKVFQEILEILVPSLLTASPKLLYYLYSREHVNRTIIGEAP